MSAAGLIQTINHTSGKISLNDGNEMPVFGLGVYKVASGDAERVVSFAIRHAGYRLIDTAQYYENEEDVGRALKSSDVPRDKIFIVTKLMHHGYDECKTSFARSLEKLGVDYVDLFLIHSPRTGKNLESYDAMVELQKQGLIRSIGVSNFNTNNLEALRKAGKPTPAVNQIELHAYNKQTDIVEYCRAHGIAVMGYTPLTRGRKLNDPPLLEIAEKHGRSAAQILLRWSVQKGYVTIPKSTNLERIVENSKVFDFELTAEDMEQMEKLPTQVCTSVDINIPWEG